MSDTTPDRKALNRRRICARLWQEYLDSPGFYQFDRWLANVMRREKSFGRRDRQAYSEALFAAMRFGYLAAFAMRAGKRDGASDAALRGFAGKATQASVMKSLWAALDAENFLSAVEWRYRAEGGQQWPLGETELPPYLLATLEHIAALARTGSLEWRLLWHGIPLQYAPALQARREASGWSDEQLERFLALQSSRPPLWLRLNHPEQRPAVLAALAEVFEVEELDGAIAARGSKGIFELDCYKSGAIEIQDLASQRISERFAVSPGQRVWDACAGGGGKTLAAAARMQNKGSLYASDIREDKLDELKRRARKAGVHNVRTQVWNGEAPFALPKEVARHGGFDWVLVDAPCSSSGTWRRNPDARFREMGKDIGELLSLQQRLLRNAANAVAPGGALVYATCSWREDENEDQVHAFLAAHAGWTLEQEGLLGCPWENADTMFAAVMRRTASLEGAP